MYSFTPPVPTLYPGTVFVFVVQLKALISSNATLCFEPFGHRGVQQSLKRKDLQQGKFYRPQTSSVL